MKANWLPLWNRTLRMRCLRAMQGTEEGRDAVVIGRAVSNHPGMVVMKTEIGGTRIIDMPFNEQLPRIC